MPNLAEEMSNEVESMMLQLQEDGLSQQCSITNYGDGNYDTSTGSFTRTEESQTVVGSIFDASSSPSTYYNLDNSLIKSGDHILFLSPKDIDSEPVTIEPDSLVEIDSSKYTVIASGKISPGGTVIAYNAILRG